MYELQDHCVKENVQKNKASMDQRALASQLRDVSMLWQTRAERVAEKSF